MHYDMVLRITPTVALVPLILFHGLLSKRLSNLFFFIIEHAEVGLKEKKKKANVTD